MNIVMMTNTYRPHVGGVANSVHRFTTAFRDAGHRVLVVAPEYDGAEEEEADVLRMPALQNFNGSDFAVSLPVGFGLDETLDDFAPDLIHSHHPYLLGDTALTVAAQRNLPLVFTHHTMYEHYTHYVPLELPQLKNFVVELSTGYANLCDHVIAPSRSVAEILRERGVETPMTEIPTGVDLEQYGSGDGAAARRRLGVPEGAFLVGHVGRLAREKNLPFLTEAVVAFLHREESAHAVFVGNGRAREEMERQVARGGMENRCHFAGVLTGDELVDTYHAMDAFAFASRTETQGMVLVEALAAGTPVVALDAPGAREVVRDEENGRLLREEEADAFAAALEWLAAQPAERRQALREQARASAAPFATGRCVEKILAVYRRLLEEGAGEAERDRSDWDAFRDRLAREWALWSNRVNAVGQMFAPERRAETP